MNIIEESVKLKESILKYQARIPELEKEITEKSKLQLELDEAELKAVILEERGWEKKKEEAKENRARIHELKEEINKAQEAVEILKEKQKESRQELMNAFREKYYGECANDLKEYGKKLKEAAGFEEKLIERRREIEREIIRTLSDGIRQAEIPSTILPAFSPFLTAGPFTPENKSLYKYFMKNCEEQGINID